MANEMHQSASTGLAPVVLFAYARPVHLRRTLDSLLTNREASSSALYLYCDAPGRPEHAAQVQAVRRMAKAVEGFASVTRVYRERNLGLAASIIGGVGEVVARHGRVIVVEDDLVLSPHFLRYMNDGLACYADDEKVASIHGYLYPVRAKVPETFFLRGADCWGWATWARAWAHFEPDGQLLRQQLLERGLAREFDYEGAYPYFKMLDDQIAGINDSWAIRWHASCFLDDLLTLYPGRSLVHNIGNDGSGTHGGRTRDFAQQLGPEPVSVLRQALEPSIAARAAFLDYFRCQRRPMARLRGLLRRAAGLA